MSLLLLIFLPPLFALAQLSALLRAEKAPSTTARPVRYTIHQGVGNLMEEKGARVCFVHKNGERCWEAGDGISEVTAKPIDLLSGRRLLLVTALSMGGSDGTIFLALLDEQNQRPVNLLPSAEISSANEGQWDCWQLEDVSQMPVILTADPVWGDEETRASAHLYKIKAYTYDVAISKYIQKLEYKSREKYSGGKDVIAMEKQTVIARLKGSAVE